MTADSGNAVLYCAKRSKSEKAFLPTKSNFCDCCRKIGHLLCGVEMLKRFVNVHLHSIVSNLKRIGKISAFPSSGKISANIHDH